jgi:hypothetical protein
MMLTVVLSCLCVALPRSAMTESQVVASDAPRLELVDQIGGAVRAVAVQGHFAYLGVGPRLLVLDIGDPAAPRQVGQTLPLLGVVRSVVVSGNVAYVGAGHDGGVVAIDIANPTLPFLLGSIDTPGDTGGLALEHGTLYVADGQDGGLRIIDVREPRRPIELGAFDTNSDAGDVVVFAGFAFVSNGGTDVETCQMSQPHASSGLQVVDVADPRQPRFVGTGPMAHRLAKFGSSYLVATQVTDWSSGYLDILDISRPNDLRLVGQLKLTGAPVDVVVAGSRALVIDGSGINLTAIDISTPSKPQRAGTTPLYSWSTAIAASGDLAFFTGDWIGLTVWSTAAADNALELGSFRTMGPVDRIAVSGDRAAAVTKCVAAQVDLRSTVPEVFGDFSVAAARVEPGSLWLEWLETAVGSRSALVAGWHRDNDLGALLRLDEVAAFGDPATVLRRDLGEPYSAVSLGDHVAFATGAARDQTQPQLLLFDASDAVNTPLVGSTPLMRATYALAAMKGYVYGVLPSDGLLAIDVRDASRPREVGQVMAGLATQPAFIYDLAAGDGYLYLTTGDDNSNRGTLLVVDAKDPEHPRLVGQTPIAGQPFALAVSGHVVGVALGNQGIAVYDVADPTGPRFVNAYDTPGTAHDIAAWGDRMYVVDQEAGLLALAVHGGDQVPPPARWRICLPFAGVGRRGG